MRRVAGFILTLTPFGLVYAGLSMEYGHGVALIGVGFLAWLDLQLPDRGQ